MKTVLRTTAYAAVTLIGVGQMLPLWAPLNTLPGDFAPLAVSIVQDRALCPVLLAASIVVAVNTKDGILLSFASVILGLVLLGLFAM